MDTVINGQAYELCDRVRQEKARRAGFCALARETFGLDFESWNRDGWWSERYIPYTLFHGDAAVSNVSVNVLDFQLDGERKRFVQLGTVMTAPAYRGRGLCRRLMERVLADWLEACDLVYLYANDSAAEFYPRFGFQKAEETDFFAELGKPAPQTPNCRRLELDRPEDLKLFLSCVKSSNPFSRCAMEENPGLVMFYCGSFLKDCVYYVEPAKAAVVAEPQEDGLLCYDVFGGEAADLPALLSAVAGPEQRPAQLGFAPRPGVCSCLEKARRQEDETLFVLGKGSGLFRERRLLLPLLSHA